MDRVGDQGSTRPGRTGPTRQRSPVRWIAAPWALPLFSASVALTVLARAGILDEPILVDRAYFVYLGQALLRGEPIYTQTFVYYPPLGPLVSAASMWVGQLFDVPTYLAPRFTSVLIGAACAGLMFELCRGATRSSWSALVGALALIGFGTLTTFILATLEPKLLLLLFTLLAGVAVQRRRWGLTGLASGAAVICWQPGALIGLASAAVLISAEGGRRPKAIGRYALGFGVGILPAAVYLTVTGTWWGFWQRAALFPFRTTLHLAARPGKWLQILEWDFGNEIVVFAVAAVGFGGFALCSAGKGTRRAVESWLAPRLGGMPILAVGWIVFNTLEFQGWADMVPILPVVAFWAAWAFEPVVGFVRRHAQRLWGRDRGARSAHLVVASLTAAWAVYALADAWFYTPAMTLKDQRVLLASILTSAGPNDKVVAYGASEVYILADRPSPNGFLSMNRFFLPVAHVVGLNGCEDMWRQLMGHAPAVVVIRRWSWQSGCVRHMGRGLLAQGYSRSRVELRIRRHMSYLPDPRDIMVVPWDVYSPPGA